MKLSQQEESIRLAFFYDLPKELAYSFGADLTELRLMRRDDGWLAVVKVTKRKRPYVAFVGGSSYADLLNKVAAFCWQADPNFKYDEPWSERKKK